MEKKVITSFGEFNKIYESATSPMDLLGIAARIKKETNLNDQQIKDALSKLVSGSGVSSLGVDAVKVLQSLVRAKVDGQYGRGTTAAVKEFQTKELLMSPNDPERLKRPDGKWGKNTAAKFVEKWGPALQSYGIKLTGVSGYTPPPTPLSEIPEVCFYTNKIIVALSGFTEDEEEIIDTIESIEDKGSSFLKQIEDLFDSLGLTKKILRNFGAGISGSILRQAVERGLKNPSAAKESIAKITEIVRKESRSSDRKLTLRDCIGYYFNDNQRRILNGVLPEGFQKFKKVDKID